MAQGPLAGVFGYVRHLFAEPASDDQSDSALLRRFVERNDQPAFATLVQRYSGLVMRVCRQVLQNSHDAEDAFQATFVVLAKKAGTIRQGEALVGWLHQVAYHCAVQARSRGAKRQVHEKQVAAMRKEETSDVTDLQDIWPILHDEVNRLPDKYRTPVVLCYLDGKTNEEAASQLNWPVGTVKTRLSQGRDLLKDRLQRRGVVLPIGLLGAALVSEVKAEAAVSTALMEATVRAASLLSAGKTPAAAGVSLQVNILADSAIHSLLLAKLKAIAASIIFALGLTSLVGGLGYYHMQTPEGLPGLSYFKPPLHADTPGEGDPFTPDQPLQTSGPATFSWPAPYGTQTTTYPQANPAPGSGEGTVSSREAARQNGDQLPSRQEQYNKLIEEQQKQEPNQGKADPSPANGQPAPQDKNSEQSSAVTPPPQSRPETAKPADPPAPRWWESIWLPW